MSWDTMFVRDRITGAVHLGLNDTLDIPTRTIRSVCGATLALGALSVMSWKETRRDWKLGAGAKVCLHCEEPKPC